MNDAEPGTAGSVESTLFEGSADYEANYLFINYSLPNYTTIRTSFAISFGEGLDYRDWSKSLKGMIRYALDLAVALGIVVRTNQKRDGEYVYESQIYENSKL